MSREFHEGELLVQRRAGVQADAEKLSGMLGPASLDGGIGRFLAAQSFAAMTARDRDGRLWTSPLVGAPGFLEGQGRRLRIHAGFADADPLHGVSVGRSVGLIAVDFDRRRRARINGTLVVAGPDGFEVDADQTYGNCPQYISQRHLDDPGETATPDGGPAARWSAGLTDAHRAALRRADTMFVGTIHPDRGADASHRGGNPGFVRVEGDRIWWPDYPGNNLFNTLGNLAVDDTAALLVVDFERGTALHLSGRATLEWTERGAPGDDGRTGRRVSFTPDRIVETAGLPLHVSGDVRPSPVSPPIAGGVDSP
ncbi:MAG TPA: pyridoxamine 5'-phosphate oxidase family protein [Pseudonocardia sp.]|nr:pyridoxamine 5'-phosphate oxidase family protein [Pseudonocardia sp.]